MAFDASVPRTRRALLAGGLGGLAAVAATAIGRPLAMRAGDGEPIVVGGEYTATSVTKFDTGSTGEPALWGKGSGDLGGVFGTSEANTGVHGFSDAGTGVFGNGPVGQGVFGKSSSGTGVYGTSQSEKGVYGHSASNIGVHGASPSHTGVLGTCDTGWGVHGASDSSFGVVGSSSSTGAAAIAGRSGGNSTGLLGFSGGSGAPIPVSPPKTGVYGRATQDANARGVHGYSSAGRGVYGQATSGTGLYGTATTGYALRTSGRVKVDKASGVATIPATKESVVVTPGLDVTTTSLVLLTPKGDIGSGRRLWYTADATNNRFTIRVSSAVTADLKVGWLLLG